MSRYHYEPPPPEEPRLETHLVLAHDVSRDHRGWRRDYGWLLTLYDYRDAGGARRYRDLPPGTTPDGARLIARQELAANDRIAFAIIRCKDFDPYVDRWSGRRPQLERDHDLLPERVRLDSELEEDD